MSAREELLTILPLNGQMRLFNVFMDFDKKSQLPLFQLLPITNDGAPAMVGHTSGSIAPFKQSEFFQDILHYHHIISCYPINAFHLGEVLMWMKLSPVPEVKHKVESASQIV